MKRTFIIRNIIIAIIVVGIIASVSYYFLEKNKREYEIEKIDNYSYFVQKEDGKYGVIDKQGNTIISPKYDDVIIPNPSLAIFACYKDGEVKMLNEKQEEILKGYSKVEPIKLNNIASNLMYEKSVLKYEENGKFGLINLKGKKITKAIYNEIEGLPYKEGELIAKIGEKSGVINIKGKKMVSMEYDKIAVDGYYVNDKGYRYSGYIVANKTSEGFRYGYIDYNGKEILKTDYNEISRIIDIENKETVYLVVAKNGQYGLIKNGKQLINNEYQSIEYDGTNNVLTIERNQKYGIATIDGEVIVPTKYEQIDITGIYIYAQNEQGVTVYNSNGTEANIDRNTVILNTDNEKYKIRVSNKEETQYGVIEKDGKQVIEEKYKYIEYLYDDYFIASNEKSQLGVIDNKDNEKIKIENDSIQRVEGCDLIQATKEDMVKLYSSKMEKLCELSKASIETKDDYIIIYNEDETLYFTKDGKSLTNKDVYKNNTLFAKNDDGKWGFENKDGQMVVEAEFDNVTEFNEYGFAGVKKDGKWGVINAEGKEVVAPIYELNSDTVPSFIGKYYKVTYGFGESYYTSDIK